jgi:predicted RNase H-like nuclease (RuvC/YqgF family)
MKYFLTLIISLVISLSSIAQSTRIEYPSFYIVGGDTLGIIISIEQAQALDNDLELYSLFEKMHISCDSTIKRYVSVVNEYNNQVAILEAKAKSLETTNQAKDDQIGELNYQILNYAYELEMADEQLRLKGTIISNLEKRITGLKLQRASYSIGTGLVGVGIGILVGILIAH